MSSCNIDHFLKRKRGRGAWVFVFIVCDIQVGTTSLAYLWGNSEGTGGVVGSKSFFFKGMAQFRTHRIV